MDLVVLLIVENNKGERSSLVFLLCKCLVMFIFVNSLCGLLCLVFSWSKGWYWKVILSRNPNKPVAFSQISPRSSLQFHLKVSLLRENWIPFTSMWVQKQTLLCWCLKIAENLACVPFLTHRNYKAVNVSSFQKGIWR